MKKHLLLTLFVAILASLGALTVQAADKVQVCHRPPGTPDNFHTITVGENSLAAHLAHGDIAGNCSASCDTLCDDGNACTVDHEGDCEELGCLATPEPVNCDDSLLCTVDSCDPEAGCQYAPIVCDDGDDCTIDACNPSDGQCNALEKDCGALGVCLSETGDCDYPCDGITCDPIDQCHAAGECVLPGDCVDGLPLADGTACDDGDVGTINDQCNEGVCSGEVTEVTCPCDFSTAHLDCIFDGANPVCYGTSDPVTLIIFDSSVPPANGNTSPDPTTQWCGFDADSDLYPEDDSVMAYLEYGTFWNIPSFNEEDPERWPICSANSFLSVLGTHNNLRPGGFSQEQADVCHAELLEYVTARGLSCIPFN